MNIHDAVHRITPFDPPSFYMLGACMLRDGVKKVCNGSTTEIGSTIHQWCVSDVLDQITATCGNRSGVSVRFLSNRIVFFVDHFFFKVGRIPGTEKIQ